MIVPSPTCFRQPIPVTAASWQRRNLVLLRRYGVCSAHGMLPNRRGWRVCWRRRALTRFVASLPADLAACVLVVLHVPESAPSALAAILDRAGPLPARMAADGEPLRPGVVLVAPPGRHLLVAGGRARLSTGPRENGHRPAVDVLFRSAARACDDQVTAVVLSGMLDDGAVGAAAVRTEGGLVLAQDPADALYDQMPATVIQRVGADAVGSASELAALVASSVRGTTSLPHVVEDPDPVAVNGGTVAGLASFSRGRERPMSESVVEDNTASGRSLGPPSGYMCPDCQGTLYAVGDEPVLRFRCRVGHAWGAEGLLGQQDLSVEAALWVALRTLEEKAELCKRMAAQAGDRGYPLTWSRFSDASAEAEASAGLIRQLLADDVVPRLQESAE